MGEKLWVGLDAGVRQSAICIIDDNGRLIAQHDVEATANAVAEKIYGSVPAADLTIAIEAGGNDHLARELRNLSWPVIVFEARQAHRFLEISRNKTDENDARGLAELARLGATVVSQVHQPGQACRRIRTQLRLREALIRQRMLAENTIRSNLRQWGLHLPAIYSEAGVRESYEAVITQAPREAVEELRHDLEPLVALATDLRRFLRDHDRRLRAIARQHDVCRRLMTVPGVGTIAALSFYSAVEDPKRFRNIADIAAYLGLTPRIAQSGATRRGGRISKMGNTMTRSHLYSAANVLLVTSKKECAIKEWGAALRNRLGLPKARVAVARKLAVVMASIWKSGGVFVAYPVQSVSLTVNLS